ncbi:hypothetical protein BFL43_11245 [Williamsia sp. 1135]|nr:hypothetical protein BFL43_11245 [Williamsia sp. 1135]
MDGSPPVSSDPIPRTVALDAMPFAARHRSRAATSGNAAVSVRPSAASRVASAGASTLVGFGPPSASAGSAEPPVNAKVVATAMPATAAAAARPTSAPECLRHRGIGVAAGGVEAIGVRADPWSRNERRVASRVACA